MANAKMQTCISWGTAVSAWEHFKLDGSKSRIWSAIRFSGSGKMMTSLATCCVNCINCVKQRQALTRSAHAAYADSKDSISVCNILQRRLRFATELRDSQGIHPSPGRRKARWHTKVSQGQPSVTGSGSQHVTTLEILKVWVTSIQFHSTSRASWGRFPHKSQPSCCKMPGRWANKPFGRTKSTKKIQKLPSNVLKTWNHYDWHESTWSDMFGIGHLEGRRTGQSVPLLKPSDLVALWNKPGLISGNAMQGYAVWLPKSSWSRSDQCLRVKRYALQISNFSWYILCALSQISEFDAMQVAVFVNPKPGFRLVLPLKVFSPSLKRTPWQTDDEVHDVFLVPF